MDKMQEDWTAEDVVKYFDNELAVSRVRDLGVRGGGCVDRPYIDI